MIKLSLKDPVYGLNAWQGEVATFEDWPELAKAMSKVQADWQARDIEERERMVRSWQRVIKRALPIEIKPLRATMGLSTSQIEQDVSDWREADLSHDDLDKLDHSKPACFVTNVADLGGMVELMRLLAAGFAVVACVSDFLVTTFQIFKQKFPEPELRELIQFVVIDDWEAIGLSNLEIACCHFYGSIAGARAVHQDLAGRFDLPTKFIVSQYPTETLTAPVSDEALMTLLEKSFHHSGQAVNNLKRLIVPADQLVMIKKQIRSLIKQIRVAAFDANPSPFMSSMPNKTIAKHAMEIYDKHSQKADIVVPMKQLMGGSSMITPGVIVFSAEEAENLKTPVPAPLLELIVRASDA